MKLPELDRGLLQRWGLIDDFEVIEGGWCSRVYGSGEVVLKVPFIGEEITHGWRAALVLSGGIGVEVLDHDPESGAILMRRVRPGTSLGRSGLSFEAMREIFVESALVIQNLPVDGLMTMAEYFYETPEKIPQVKELLKSGPPPRFLHGDLHHANILDGGDRWIVIDPKGVWGDLHYELLAWLRNPIDRLREVTDLEAHVRNELETLCERLSLDPLRVVRWALLENNSHRSPGHPWSNLPGIYANLYEAYSP